MRNAIIFCLGLILSVMSSQPLLAAGEFQDLGAQALADVNAYRAEHGLSALQVDKKVTKAAKMHAKDMFKKGFFGHKGSNGSTVGKRLRKQRYRFCLAAENIAKGAGTLDEVLAGWMNSPGHRRNMLNPDAADFGLVLGPGNLWVMVLGKSGC